MELPRSKMRLRHKWLWCISAIIPLGFGIALCLLPRERISLRSYNQIYLGMSVDEVKTLIGEPGVYTNPENVPGLLLTRSLSNGGGEGDWPEALRRGIVNWIGRSAVISMAFDSNHRVVWKDYRRMNRASWPWPLEGLGQWLEELLQ